MTVHEPASLFSFHGQHRKAVSVSHWALVDLKAALAFVGKYQNGLS
jgi:hypothetical protein